MTRWHISWSLAGDNRIHNRSVEAPTLKAALRQVFGWLVLDDIDGRIEALHIEEEFNVEGLRA